MAQIALFDTEQLKKEILDFIDTFVRMKFENRYLPEHETEEAFAPFRESFEGLSRIRDLSGVKEQIGISGEKLDFFMDRMGRIEEEFAEHNERYTETELDLEKQHVDPEEIIRGNSEDYPEIETYKRKYFIDILKNRIYDKHVLLKNILLFFGYYMDIPEEALKFDNLAQYHMYRCSRDFESMKSIMGSYSKEVIDNLTRQTRTIKGEFLRSVQEVQIANFLYLHIQAACEAGE